MEFYLDMHKRQELEKFSIKKSLGPMEDLGFFIDNALVPFKHDEVAFNANNAWWMAEHSRLAYVGDKETIKTVLLKSGYTGVEFLWDDDSGTKVYFAWNDEHVAVTFTGTELNGSTADIVTDLKFIPTSSGQGGLVHTGFKTAIDSVWVKLNDLLKEHAHKSIWLTGHSLGGALAIITASRFTSTACYTFGAPRVGNKKFNKTIPTPVFRMTKSNDIVTRIPLPPLYRHHGDTVFIDNDQNIMINPSMSTMLRARLGGDGIKIAWLIFKIIVLRSSLDFILSYLHGHSPYNYSVYMWNNIDN